MDFKELRVNKLKLSVEEFAKEYEVSIEKVEEWDLTNEVTFSIIEKIMKKTSMSFEEITNYKKPKIEAIQLDNTWENLKFTYKNYLEYINKIPNEAILKEYWNKYIKDLKNGIEKKLKKPIISFIGRSDTGKSTLINSLIGIEKMPTSWTPTTSIAVYVKHIEDKPKFIKEDVWIFSDSLNGKNFWDISKLYDEEYCKRWKIASGEIEILKKFGIRQNGNVLSHVGSAIVFIDAPILLNCDILDLPGYGTEMESDDRIAFEAINKTDILIYLSQANGFMRIEDITYLKENIRCLSVWENKKNNNLKPFSNLFIVASQAHTVANGNKKELKNILLKGSENFTKVLSNDYWKRRSEISGYNYGINELNTRFFTYTTDIPELCQNFINELKETIELFPKVVEAEIENFISNYIMSRKTILEIEIKSYKEMIESKNKYEGLLKEIEKNKLQKIKEDSDNKKLLREKIKKLTLDSLNEYNDYYSSILNVDNITVKIKEKKIKKKKEDIDFFISKFQDEIHQKCLSILEKNLSEFVEIAKKYVKKYKENINVSFEKFAIENIFEDDYIYTKFLRIGAMGVLDTAIFLGPIGMTISLIIAGILGIISFFGGNWEKTVAKKIVKVYEENDCISKYKNIIKSYWGNIETIVDKEIDEIEKEWNNYVELLKINIDNFNKNNIDNNINTLKNIQKIFEKFMKK
ncbi:dynamin family protein [Fusobacterium nucleatum]|uniref:dynamin family protein n=1 Tax=Fusobacterium vincentii TaxID=155615 RepID=UPI00040C3066|nr:dynamin family protein [Fusobacterium vincentii]ALF20340.1 hypothetical protein RN99_07630 [Fusobacterium vincentii ChDC F8]PIH01806.1 Dynamin family protein [Fusobacterium vincentii]